MIIYYSKECGSCKGTQELALVKNYAKQAGVEFMERRTIFWDRFEKEAQEISEAFNVELPFFYGSNSKIVYTEEQLKNVQTIHEFIAQEK